MHVHHVFMHDLHSNLYDLISTDMSKMKSNEHFYHKGDFMGLSWNTNIYIYADNLAVL